MILLVTIFILGIAPLTSLAFADENEFENLFEIDDALTIDDNYIEFYDEFGYYNFGFASDLKFYDEYGYYETDNDESQTIQQPIQENNDLREQVDELKQHINELEQEVKILNESQNERPNIIYSLILGITQFFQDTILFPAQGEQILQSTYIIEKLKGDSLGTHYYWQIIPGTPLYVNIKNPANLSLEKIQIVRDAIQSTEFYEIDDNKLNKAPKGTISRYYLGWQGALSEIEQDTKNAVPKSFEIISVGNSAGDIIITLTNMIDGDGTAGITKSTAYGNQILKSEITIFDASSLSDRELEKITRHEFGHALGLVHSTAPEDLMHPENRSPYPYISHCNVSAITALYDGKTNDVIICEK